MSRARVAVVKVISKQLSVTAAAAEYGYSRQHLHRLVARCNAGGLDAVDARSRRPLSSPQATEGKVRDFIVKTRLELTAAGWDAGRVTVAWHLERAGLHVPSTSTIRRILHAAGPAARTTSASASRTAARKSSLSPTLPAAPSSNCGPGKSCPSMTSTPPATTGATKKEARADDPDFPSPKTLLRCHTCRDSRHRWS
jgi:transposase